MEEESFLEHLTKAINDPKPTFADGISGVGWLLQTLINNEILEENELHTLLKEIDSLVCNYAMGQLKVNNHHFLYGPIGEMVYLVSRVNENPDVKEFLTEISKQLIGMGKHSENGFLSGTVKSLGEISTEGIYLAKVTLPNGLLTSYNIKVEFSPEMEGSAEIITDDLRVLERLFIQFNKLAERKNKFIESQKVSDNKKK